MSLMGKPLVIGLACLTVLLPIATFLLWPRLRGHRVVRGSGRLGMLFAGQLAAVLFVAAVANDYGQFFPTWPDLVGSSNQGASLQSFGGTGHHSIRVSGGGPSLPQGDPGGGSTSRPGAAGSVRVLGATNWSTRSQRSSRGEVELANFTGHWSGLTEQGYIYLPPQYFQPAYKHHRFPAVEVLSGYPGSSEALATRLGFPSLAERLEQSHRTVPMILVMLSSTVAPPRDTECTDVPNGPQAETFLAREVPAGTNALLRTRASDWGIVGYSTGGYCAAKILMGHYTTFAAGISLSGYYHTLHDVTTGSLWGGSPALRHENNPEWMLTHYPPPPVSLFVTISKEETSSEGYPDTMRFLHDVKPPMHVTAMIVDHGGHDFATWGRELPTAMHWMSRLLAKHA
jgi:S-formylglutathione hydrolase FrmB